MPKGTAKNQAPVELEWGAPPERRSPSKYRAALDEIKARPGTWARLRVFETSSSAYSARKTVGKAAGPDERWEIKVAKLENGDEHGIWARFRTDEQMKAAKK